MRFTRCQPTMKRLGVMIGIVLFLAGCGMSQQEKMARDRLEQAHLAYQRAKSDPSVTGTAQIPLMDAEKELQAAENTSDYTKMEHLAYLAQKKAETAEVLAQGTAADRELDRLQKQGNEAIILKKEQEAKAARGEAAEKGRQLERAQAEAGQTRAEMERAQAEAGQSRAEMERAKADADRIRAEAEKSRADNEQLMKELSELKGKQTDRGIVLTIGDVLFSTGKADLSPRANASIDKLAEFLRNHPDRNLSIEGHTDSVGSDTYNDELSERRAEAVKSALVAKGVDSGRIVTKGLGKRFPVATNATAQGRQLNRRVEVVVLNEVANAQPQAQPTQATQPAQPSQPGTR